MKDVKNVMKRVNVRFAKMMKRKLMMMENVYVLKESMMMKMEIVRIVVNLV